MSLLLDTHALLWWLADDPRLSVAARGAVAEADLVHVSAVSAYEIMQKHRLGKLPDAAPFVDRFAEILAAENFQPLAVTLDHAALAGRMDNPHRDPFDRLLIAQGLLDRLTVVSADRVFDVFGVARLW